MKCVSACRHHPCSLTTKSSGDISAAVMCFSSIGSSWQAEGKDSALFSQRC